MGLFWVIPELFGPLVLIMILRPSVDLLSEGIAKISPGYGMVALIDF